MISIKYTISLAIESIFFSTTNHCYLSFFYKKKNCLLQNNLFYFGHIWFLIFSAKLIFGSFFCFMFDLLVSQRFVRFVCRFCEFIEQKFKFVTIIVFAASAQLWLHTIKKKAHEIGRIIESKWVLLFDWCMLMCIEILTHVLRTQIDSVIITTSNRKNVTLAHSHSRQYRVYRIKIRPIIWLQICFVANVSLSFY